MAWPRGASRMRSDMTTKDHVVGEERENSGGGEWNGEVIQGFEV